MVDARESWYAGSGTRSLSTGARRRSRDVRLRRGSLAVIVLLVAEYALGACVDLFVSVPGADHGGGLGRALAHGPASLSVHAALGLLLGLAALGVAGQAVLTPAACLIAASGAGLLAMIFASVAKAAAPSAGDRSASLAMAVLARSPSRCSATWRTSTCSARGRRAGGRAARRSPRRGACG